MRVKSLPDMKLFTITGFRGHWPVGTAAVVVAKTAEAGARLLEKRLKDVGLEQEIDPTMLKQVSMSKVSAIVLNDGDY